MADRNLAALLGFLIVMGAYIILLIIIFVLPWVLHRIFGDI